MYSYVETAFSTGYILVARHEEQNRFCKDLAPPAGVLYVCFSEVMYSGDGSVPEAITEKAEVMQCSKVYNV